MPGNLQGAQRAQSTLLEKFGSPEALRAWRQSIGRRGGQACVPLKVSLSSPHQSSAVSMAAGVEAPSRRTA